MGQLLPVPGPGRARASQGGTVINLLHLQVLEKFVPKITHENDGLIFNSLEDVRHLLYVHTLHELARCAVCPGLPAGDVPGSAQVEATEPQHCGLQASHRQGRAAWVCPASSVSVSATLTVCMCMCRMLKERIGQLWVGGYHQPFSVMDLKVWARDVSC